MIAESILLNTSTVLATSSAFPTGFDSVQCRKGWCKNLYSCQAKFSFFFNSFSDLLQWSHQSGHWPWDLIYVLSLWIWCHLNSICRGYFGTCLQIYWLRHKRVLLYFFFNLYSVKSILHIAILMNGLGNPCVCIFLSVVWLLITKRIKSQLNYHLYLLAACYKNYCSASLSR